MPKPTLTSFGGVPPVMYGDTSSFADFYYLVNRGNESYTQGFLVTSVNALAKLYYYDNYLQSWVLFDNSFSLIVSKYKLGFYPDIALYVTKAVKIVHPFAISGYFNPVYFRSVYNAVNDPLSVWSLDSLNVSNTDVALRFNYTICKFSSNVEINLNSYFSSFDKNINDEDVRCFKCGSALSVVNNNLQCINSHTYTFSQYILEHSSFLKSLITEIENNKICNS